MRYLMKRVGVSYLICTLLHVFFQIIIHNIGKKIILKNHIFLKDCPNGKLDKAKFKSVFMQLYPDGKPEKYSNYVFEHFDVDKSNFISFSEFLLVISALSDKELNKRLALAFKIIDINDDHKIDAKELEKIIDAIAELKAIQRNERKDEQNAKNMAITIFKKFNRDHDKFLTEDEFVEGCISEPTFIALLLPP